MSGIVLALIGLIVFLVFGGVNYYIGKKLFDWFVLFLPNLNAKLFFGIFILLSLVMVLGNLPVIRPVFLKQVFNWIGSYWMGAFIYLFLLTVLSDLIILLGKAIGLIANPMPQAIRFWSGLVVILATTAVVAFGLFNAKQLKLVSYDVTVKDKAISQLLKIAMVSDLHIGAVNSEQQLEKTVAMINSIEPDIVLIPGDIFNDDYYLIQNPDTVVELFQQIKSKHGVYASLGNHDGGKNHADFVSLLTRSGIKLLNDEALIVDGKVALLGRVDASPVGGFPGFSRKSTEEMQALIAELPKELSLIVLDHNPKHIDEYGKETDLIVAGHTHRGQLFPGNLFTKALFAVDYGHYRKDENSPQVVVSSGAGTWAMPMRVGSQTEVVEIRLQEEKK